MPKPPPPSSPQPAEIAPPFAPRASSRRGRKPKALEALQRHLVACRLTDAELEQLDAGRGVLTRGEGLRQLALARRLPPAIPAVNRQAYDALARASANLNQLSRRANIAGQLEIAALWAALKTFRLALLGVTPATLDAADEEEIAEADAHEEASIPGEAGANDPGPGELPA